MNTKKSLIMILIGACIIGILTNVSADEIHPDMDTTVGIDNTGDSWEDQPFWDNPEVKDGDLIIAPSPDNGEEDEQNDELVILSGETQTEDENTVISSEMPVIGAVGLIGLLGTALILHKRKKME